MAAPDSAGPARALTGRRELFVAEYLIDLNATQAAIRAGYSEKRAHVQGHELLKEPAVQAAISAGRAERMERTGVDADYVLQRLVEIDQMDVLDIMNDDMALKPVSQWPKVWRQYLTGFDLAEMFEGTAPDGGKGALRVDVLYDRKNFPVLSREISYDYTLDELRKSAALKKPLDAGRAQAAIETHRMFLNNVALNGQTNAGITGLLNCDLVPQGMAPKGNWDVATPEEIIADVNAAILGVWEGTHYNSLPDTIGVAPEAFANLVKPRSEGSDMSILKWLQENNLAKTQAGKTVNFVPVYGLNTAGAGGTRRLIAYEKNQQNLVMHVPMPLRFLAPQPVGLKLHVPGEFKYSGVTFRRPKTAYYMDGI